MEENGPCLAFFTGKVRCARPGSADGDLQIEEEARNDSE